MINKISSIHNSNTINFKRNIDTRTLLANADNEDNNTASNNKPMIEKIKITKQEKISRFKKSHGDSIYLIYRSCLRKSKRFPNESLAEKAARRLEKKTGRKFSTYFCHFCEQWHLCKAVNKFAE